jgi:hypothetical protein
MMCGKRRLADLIGTVGASVAIATFHWPMTLACQLVSSRRACEI